MPSPESVTSEGPTAVYGSMLSFGRPKIEHVCSNCKTTDTPVWRRDVAGRHVCNACGIYSRVHKQDRPIQKASDSARVSKSKRKLSDPTMSPGEYRYRQQIMFEMERRMKSNSMVLPPPVRSRLPIFSGQGSQFSIAGQSNRPIFPGPNNLHSYNERRCSSLSAQSGGPNRPTQSQSQYLFKLAPIKIASSEERGGLSILANEAVLSRGQISVKSLIE